MSIIAKKGEKKAFFLFLSPVTFEDRRRTHVNRKYSQVPFRLLTPECISQEVLKGESERLEGDIEQSLVCRPSADCLAAAAAAAGSSSGIMWTDDDAAFTVRGKTKRKQ